MGLVVSVCMLNMYAHSKRFWTDFRFA